MWPPKDSRHLGLPQPKVSLCFVRHSNLQHRRPAVDFYGQGYGGDDRMPLSGELVESPYIARQSLCDTLEPTDG